MIAPAAVRSTRAAFVLGFLLATLPGASHAAIPSEATDDTWIEVKSEHFRVVSNAREGIATSVARKLELFAAFLAQAQPGLRAVPALPTDVFVFADTTSLKPYTDRDFEGLMGFSLIREDRNLLVTPALGESEDRNYLLCQSYSHVYNDANFGRIPLWLSTALSEYYGTFRIHGGAEFGKNRPELIEILKQWVAQRDLIGFDLLFAFDTRSNAYRKNNALGDAMYAQGWLLVHYLEADPGRAASFARVLEALHAGQAPLDAWQASFPRADWPALQAGLKGYLKDEFLDFQRVPFKPRPDDFPCTTRTLGTPAALTELGSLLLAEGDDRQAEAEEHLRAAVQRDSLAGEAWALLGRIAEVRGDSAAAEPLDRRALRLAPDDARVAECVAAGTLKRALDRIGATGPSPEVEALGRLARERFARCLQLDPQSPFAQAGLARTYFLAGPPTTASLAMLATASQALPSRSDLAEDVQLMRRILAAKDAPEGSPGATSEAVALSSGPTTSAAVAGVEAHVHSAQEAARAGRYEDAIRDWEWLIEHDPAHRATYEGMIADNRFGITCDHARALVKTGKLAAARDSLRVAATMAPGDDAAEYVQKQIVEVEARIEVNRGLALVKAGDLKGARAAFVRARDMPIRSEFRDYVNARIAELDKALATH